MTPRRRVENGDGAHIAVQHQKTKTKQQITINDDLASVLATARQRPIVGLYVIANAKGRPIKRDTFSAAWIAARTAAGIEDVQFRDIRAMAAAAAKADGIDYQALLGHTTAQMSERYLRGQRVTVAQPNRKKL